MTLSFALRIAALDLADVKNVLAATSLNNLHNRSESFLLIAFFHYTISSIVVNAFS